MRTNRILSAALAACGAIGLSSTAHATNGYQLIGVGSYQKSVGGAVTAAPKSAMTAITNPAGMAAIGSRADFSMEAFMPERSTDFPAGDKVDSDSELYGIPAIGWTAPVTEGSDFYFGGGMYGTSGLGVDYAQTSMGGGTEWTGYSSIAFWQMAPTLAYKVNDKLKVGAALNINYQSVAFKQAMYQDINADGFNERVFDFDLGRSANAFGFGLSLGALYDVTDELTVGLSYKSEQNFSELEYNLASGDIGQFNPGTGQYEGVPAGTYKLDLDYPQQAALGVKYSPMENLDISADIKWIEWSATMDSLKVDGPGANDVTLSTDWDDQIVYALGVNYDVTSDLSVAAGFNYAESPIDDEDVGSNLLLPGVVESHYTVGANYNFIGNWEIGGHIMYAPEVTRTAKSTDPVAPGAEVALSETSAGINIGYSF